MDGWMPTQKQEKKLHKCPHEGCAATFNRPYRLEQHILLHFNFRPYICTQVDCKKSYSSKSHLDRHVNSVHLGMKREVETYRCPSCLKLYANHQNLKRHMKSHIKRLSYSCDICKMEFKNDNQLTTHKYQHTGVKPFVCELCPETFLTLYSKKRHMRYHKMYKCEECGGQFNHWNKYREHKKTVHDKRDGDFVCDQCGKSFKQRCEILRHIKTHTRPHRNKIFMCPHTNCERVYTTKSNLKQHISVKHMQIFHVCIFCNARLSTKAKLTYHLKLHERNGMVVPEEAHNNTGSFLPKEEPEQFEDSQDNPSLDINELQVLEIKVEPQDLLEPPSPEIPQHLLEPYSSDEAEGSLEPPSPGEPHDIKSPSLDKPQDIPEPHLHESPSPSEPKYSCKPHRAQDLHEPPSSDDENLSESKNSKFDKYDFNIEFLTEN